MKRKIRVEVTASVIEDKKDTIRYIVIGFISFLITVFASFNRVEILKFASSFKNISIPVFKSNKINLDGVFLSAGDQAVDPLLIKSIIDEKDGSWIIIDYRSPSEYSASHIKGAINIPLYTDYKKYLESSIPLSDWYSRYWKVQKWNKKVLLYGYWDKAKLATDLTSFLNKRSERFYVLKMGFTEFKNNFYQWVPGGDINDGSIGSYIEGSLVVPPPTNDGVPPLPTSK